MRLPRLDAARAWALAAALAAALAYAPTLGNGFVFDDGVVIVRNRLLRSLDRLPELVSSTEWGGAGIEVRAWRPLTALTYALDHAVGGLSPWSYHLSNVLLHALAAALLVGVGVRLGLTPAAAGLAGLLFALHPIHVEAVASVIGRKDVLAAFFAFATLLLHRRALARGGASLAWPVLTFSAAMLSKESGVVTLGLVALTDLAGRDSAVPGPPRRRVALYAAYVLALAGYLLLLRAVTAHASPEVPFEDNPVASAPATVRVLTAIVVIGKGLALQLLPLGQSPDWSFDAIPLATRLGDPRFLLTAAALAAWLAAGLALRRRAPIALLSLAWYACALLPASNLLFPVGTLFGERLLYLPGAGLALAAGALLAWAAARLPRPAALAAGAALAVALSAATVRYGLAWGDEERLFRLGARSAPASSKVHHKLGSLLARAGRREEALAELDLALAISPRNARAQASRAALLDLLGRREEEERAWRAVLEASPTDPDALHGLGALARDQGRLEEAAVLWQRALAAAPFHAPSLADLAGYHLLRGENALAEGLAERAVDADPAEPSAWYDLGLLRRARGDEAGSRAAFERFVACAGEAYAAEAEEVRRMLAGRPGG